MNILVLGANQVGLSVIENLADDSSNAITLVDRDNTILQDIRDRMDVQCVRGDICHPSVLQSAGAQEADLILAVTNSDERNMLACHIANLLFNPPACIACVRARDYYSVDGLLSQEKMGIVKVIDPAAAIADQIARLITAPGTLEHYQFANGKVAMVGLLIQQKSKLIGQSFQQIQELTGQISFYCAAIYRKGKLLMTEKEPRLEAHDELLILADQKHISVILECLGFAQKYRKKVIIAGAGNIGCNLAQHLEEYNFHVILFESNPSQAEKAESLLKHSVVVHGQASDGGLLQKHGIKDCEVFCAVTNVDDINIMSCMLAQSIGANRVIALIKHRAYFQILAHNNMLDNVVSPADPILGAILTYIHQSEMQAAQPIHMGDAEVLEAVVHDTQSRHGLRQKPISKLELPPLTRICAVVRNDKVCIPDHNFVLKACDRVVLFVADKKNMRAVEKFFAVDLGFF